MYRAIKALNIFLFIPALSNDYPIIIIPSTQDRSRIFSLLPSFLFF